MKKFLLLIIIAMCFTSVSKAQSTTVTTRRDVPKQSGFIRLVIDENTVVKDSTGKELTYKEWQPLLRSGEYSIRSLQRQNEKPVFSLVKLTAAEKKIWTENRQAVMGGNNPQVSSNQSIGGVAQPVFDERAVVRDSAGVIYPYAVWQAMTHTNDYYVRWFRKSDADSITYTLVKRTPKEIDAIMAMYPKPAESDRFKTGDTFSYFSGKDLKGEKFNSKTLAGKVLVLNFWFIGCPPCRAEIPDLNAIAEKYKDNKDVVFVAVGLDQGYEINDFIKNTPYNYHLIYDGKWNANKYGVHLYPTNVIINKEGKVAFSSVSNQSANPYWIKKTIEESLATK